jgi:hypothetical protein
MNPSARTISTRRGLPAALILAALALASVAAAETLPVNLGEAGQYVILAKTGISTTGTTDIHGNIGTSPADSTSITGFGLSLDSNRIYSNSARVNGRVSAANYAPPTPATLTLAVGAMEAAYTEAAGRAANVTELHGGDLGGLRLAAGVYKWSNAVSIPTKLTLDGSSNAVWIFQIAGGLTVASGVEVVLEGGAQAKNVFWQVAGVTALGTTSVMNGTILDLTAITLNSGATLHGHALAQTAVTLIANRVDSNDTGL